MVLAKKSPFIFKGFIIQESFIARKPIKGKGEFSINVTPKGKINRRKKTFQLDLIMDVSESNERFKCRVHGIGFFEFKSVTDKINLSNYFYVNAPAILFPYLRAYIAALTSLSGLEPVHLPSLNLTKLGKQLEKDTSEITVD
jgi:preprotein translocase subunit SecB